MKVQSKIKALTGRKQIYYSRKKHIWLDPGCSVRNVWSNELCGNDCLPASFPLTFQQSRGSRPGLSSKAAPWQSAPFSRLLHLDVRKQRAIQDNYRAFQILNLHNPWRVHSGCVAEEPDFFGVSFIPLFCWGFSASRIKILKPGSRMDI